MSRRWNFDDGRNFFWDENFKKNNLNEKICQGKLVLGEKRKFSWFLKKIVIFFLNNSMRSSLKKNSTPVRRTWTEIGNVNEQPLNYLTEKKVESILRNDSFIHKSYLEIKVKFARRFSQVQSFEKIWREISKKKRKCQKYKLTSWLTLKAFLVK